MDLFSRFTKYSRSQSKQNGLSLYNDNTILIVFIIYYFPLLQVLLFGSTNDVLHDQTCSPTHWVLHNAPSQKPSRSSPNLIISRTKITKQQCSEAHGWISKHFVSIQVMLTFQNTFRNDRRTSGSGLFFFFLISADYLLSYWDKTLDLLIH